MKTMTAEQKPAIRFVRPLIYAGIVAVVATVLLPRALTDAETADERRAAAAVGESASRFPEAWAGWRLSIEPIDAPGPVIQVIATPIGSSGHKPPSVGTLTEALAEANRYATVRVTFRAGDGESISTFPLSGR